MANRVSKNVELYVNASERVIQYKSVQKQITDDYWDTSIAPVLYPFWDSAKDKLELFAYKHDGSFLIQRSKYKRDFKTGTSSWVSYDFDPSAADPNAVVQFKNDMIDKFLEYKGTVEKTYQDAIAQEYSRTNTLTWKHINVVRKFLLQDSDFIFCSDYQIDEEKKNLWRQYRQYIRDIPGLQSVDSPYDIVFPITPDEYLKRKELYIEPEVVEKLGDQGINDPFLTSSYHFWKMSSNTLATFAQRMSFYIASRTITSDNSSENRVLVSNFITKFTANPDVQSARIRIENDKVNRDFIDDLLNKIETGEL